VARNQSGGRAPQLQSQVHAASSARRRSPQRRDARRLYVVGCLIVLGLGAVVVRLAGLQLADGDHYAELARRQYESRVELTPERGAIYDRNGNLLATNALSLSFAVDPKSVENPRALAAAFARALGGTPEEYLKKIGQKDRSFVWIRRKVSGAPLEILKAIDDDGVIRRREPLRRFEYDSLGAQLLGWTDVDNNGLSGIERHFDEHLRGRAGFMIMQRDAVGRRRPDIDLPQTPPEHGNGLVLTIDINVQGIVEEELARGVRSAGAASGTAVAIDPRTGEILAIASYPSFNPNSVRGADPAAMRIRAITDTYEPGSTMKAITAAAAIEEGVIEGDESIDGEGGVMQLGSHTIRDDHPVAEMNFRTAFEQSSNVAFAKIAGRLAAPRFYKYVRDFGFGIASGVDLAGEARGDVKKPNDFTEGTQQFMAFGYQLAVTPLQIACAYAAIANGGVMMKPHLLKRRLDRDGGVIEEIEPQEIRRVVSEETANAVRDLLVGAVERGTGGAARIAGLSIAGKTGTAQQLFDGAYSKEKYNASFAGFFPADDPKVALLVLLDSPTHGYYGGQVAAPIFREIARRVVNASMHGSEPELRIATAADAQRAPVQMAASRTIGVPDLRGVELDAARRVAERYGLRVMARGNGGVVVAQEPTPRTAVESRSVVTLVTGTDSTRMPELRGMSVRRAVNLLNAGRIRPRITGTGRVVAQSPAPGAAIDPRRVVAVLRCE
jgi:cell division protein FtsI (penicillin-binding protein 3)